MPICKRCGAPLNESYNFCRRCGLPVAGPENTGMPLPAPPSVPSSGLRPYNLAPAFAAKSTALPYFIWSIILFFAFNIIGTPLCVASAVYASMANDPECEKPNEKLKKSKILCITATCFDAATLCAFIAAFIIYIKPSLNIL